MLKLTFCLRRLPSLSLEEFQSEETWRMASRNPEARNANCLLLEDEARFIDLADSPLRLNREEMIYGELRRAS